MNKLGVIVNKLIDTRGNKVLCSNSKHEEYKYRDKNIALFSKFVRFGNDYFIPAISLDIDFIIGEWNVQQLCEDNNMPLPTLMVETDKGIHLHWVLENPLKLSNNKQKIKYQVILEKLSEIFKSDENALNTNSARVWRNPLLHSTTIMNEYVSLNSFKVEIDKQQTSKKKFKRFKRSNFKKVELTQVKIGERNTTLFHLIRKEAYKVYKSVDNLKAYLTTFAFKLNNGLLNPLPDSEVKLIVKSVTNWVERNFIKFRSNKAQIEFNRMLAKKKQLKILSKFLQFLTENIGITLKSLFSLSLRKGAKLIGVSYQTFNNYKKDFVKIFLNFVKNNISFFNYDIMLVIKSFTYKLLVLLNNFTLLISQQIQTFKIKRSNYG